MLPARALQILFDARQAYAHCTDECTPRTPVSAQAPNHTHFGALLTGTRVAPATGMDLDGYTIEPADAFATPVELHRKRRRLRTTIGTSPPTLRPPAGSVECVDDELSDGVPVEI